MLASLQLQVFSPVSIVNVGINPRAAHQASNISIKTVTTLIKAAQTYEVKKQDKEQNQGQNQV